MKKIIFINGILWSYGLDNNGQSNINHEKNILNDDDKNFQRDPLPEQQKYFKDNENYHGENKGYDPLDNQSQISDKSHISDKSTAIPSSLRNKVRDTFNESIIVARNFFSNIFTAINSMVTNGVYFFKNIFSRNENIDDNETQHSDNCNENFHEINDDNKKKRYDTISNYSHRDQVLEPNSFRNTSHTKVRHLSMTCRPDKSVMTEGLEDIIFQLDKKIDKIYDEENNPKEDQGMENIVNKKSDDDMIFENQQNFQSQPINSGVIDGHYKSNSIEIIYNKVGKIPEESKNNNYPCSLSSDNRNPMVIDGHYKSDSIEIIYNKLVKIPEESKIEGIIENMSKLDNNSKDLMNPNNSVGKANGIIEESQQHSGSVHLIDSYEI